MRRAVLALSICLLLVIPASAASQSLGPMQNFIFTGCDTGYSCMRLVVTIPLFRDVPNGFAAIFKWSAFFFKPGELSHIRVESNLPPDDYIGPNSSGGPTNLGLVVDSTNPGDYHRGRGWTPTGAWYAAFYTDSVGEWANDGVPRALDLQLTQTTVTPEPASLLLLVTGIGGLCAARRRRKVARR